MWSPELPDDFSQFEASDMPAFLDWFERQFTEAIALGVADAFIEGVSGHYLEVIQQGGAVPAWVETLLRYRMAAQWSYQVGVALSPALTRDLARLIPEDQVSSYRERFGIVPRDIADVPPPVRRAFNEGAAFSLSWVKRLSADSRNFMRTLISIEVLKNRNPLDAVPLLEGILRRDLIAKQFGLPAEQLSAQDIEQWLLNAEIKVLEAISHRAKMISQTEAMRMTNLGILTTMREDGDEFAFVMPHANSCAECRRLIDGRVFSIEVLIENLFKNFGVTSRYWVAALPQHPFCRHVAMRVPVRFRLAVGRAEVPKEGLVLQHYGLPGGLSAMESLGLTKPDQGWLTAAGQIS